jgi:hypothetical protein
LEPVYYCTGKPEGSGQIGGPLLALLQKGTNFALRRQAPVSMSTVLQGNLWATLVPLIPAWLVVLPAAGLWLAMPAWQIVALLATFIWTLIGASIMTMAAGGLAVYFTADDVKRRMPRAANYLIWV